jgi:hypothetical protein
MSVLAFLAYSTAYLHVEGNWWLPVPIYIEHAIFALFWTGAIAGYWGGLEALAAGARRWTHAADRAGLGAGLRRVGLLSLSPGQATAATAIMAVAAAAIVPAVPIAAGQTSPSSDSFSRTISVTVSTRDFAARLSFIHSDTMNF